MEAILGIGILMAVGLAIVGVNALIQTRRTAAWRQVADELGIEFRGDGSDLLGRYGRMKAFNAGRRRRLSNVVHADSGDVRIILGDFRYVTGGGKHQHTHHQTICILEAAELDLPHCYVRPQRWLVDAIGSLFGGQDIDFVDDPAFSRAYVLQGEREVAIRDVFDAELRDWFCSRAGRRFHFEAHQDTFLFHTGNHRKPAEATDLMQLALEIRGLLARSACVAAS